MGRKAWGALAIGLTLRIGREAHHAQALPISRVSEVVCAEYGSTTRS